MTTDRQWWWLLRHMKGETMQAIADSAGSSRQIVSATLRRLGVSHRGHCNRRWMYRNFIPRKAKKQYSTQMTNAAQRGIGWEFDIYSWWVVWRDSGKWEQRGTAMERYCMARTGDRGPYAPHNVRIATNEENQRERIDLLQRSIAARKAEVRV